MVGFYLAMFVLPAAILAAAVILARSGRLETGSGTGRDGRSGPGAGSGAGRPGGPESGPDPLGRS